MKKFLQDRKRVICILAPLMAGIFYLILCLVCLRHSVSTTEAYNAYLVRFDLGGIWDLSATGTEPPLYLFLLKIWAHIFGHADFVLRVMSAMLGALTILVIYLWIKYCHGAIAAITSAFLLATAPFFVRAGQEIGAYTLVVLIVTSASFVLQLAINAKNRVWWAFYALLLAAGLWTSYYCSLAWLAHLVYLTFFYGKKIQRKNVVFAYLTAVILWLPWVPNLISQIRTPQVAVNTELTLTKVANVATETLAYSRADELHNIPLAFCLIAVAITTILAARFTKKNAMLTTLFVVPFCALLLLSLTCGVDFDFWHIPFVGVAIILTIGVAGAMNVRKEMAGREHNTKRIRTHTLAASVGDITIIATLICGLVSVYAHEGYDLRLSKEHSADILYENIVEFDFNQRLPIVVKSVDLYYELSTYTTERNPIVFIDADFSQDYGSLRPLHRSYFGKIADIDGFLASHSAIWLVDVEPNDSTQLDFPYEGWRMTTRSDLRFGNDGELYQILKLEKEQI